MEELFKAQSRLESFVVAGPLFRARIVAPWHAINSVVLQLLRGILRTCRILCASYGGGFYGKTYNNIMVAEGNNCKVIGS